MFFAYCSLNPFNYLLGGMLVFPIWDVEVQCTEQEFGRFTPPAGQTCEAYMAPFLQQNPGYLDNPQSTTECAYCIYSRGAFRLLTFS
jgi:ATP-binding cassette subfamily G (WHITE) protein 2 (SNQ2)